MNVFEAIKWRRSVRRFAARKIERPKILRLMEAARLAPSSSNRQAWHFVVVDDPSIIARIPKQVTPGTKGIIDWLEQAPLVIVGCYTKALTHYVAQLFGHQNHLIDVSIAMTQICLSATELGIGSCFVGWFNEKELKKLLGIPRRYRVALLLALGYPLDESSEEGIAGIAPRPRKTLDEIVSYNRFGEKF